MGTLTDAQTDRWVSHEGVDTPLGVTQLHQGPSDTSGELVHATHTHQQVSMATVTWLGEVLLEDGCSDAPTQTRPGRGRVRESVDSLKPADKMSVKGVAFIAVNRAEQH